MKARSDNGISFACIFLTHSEILSPILLLALSNSSMVLIVGSSFIDEYIDYEGINCTIYQTSGTQVGYRGMSSNGENFSIQFDENIFVNFTLINEFNFNTNESLHFENNSYEISNHSICELSNYQKMLLNSSINVEYSDNETNFINDSTISNNCQLEILVDEIIEDTKIQFGFEGNISYGVTYSINDGLGEEVRTPFTSSTSSMKSYTPKKNGKFTILAEINDISCRNQTQKEIFFYNSNLDIDNDEIESINLEEDTFIKIYSVLLRGINQVIISGEISRGDSLKYRLKILVNDDEVSMFDVKKYGRFDFEIPIYLKPGEHTISIEGFGKKDEVDIVMPNVVAEIEDELIVLLNNKGIDFDPNESLVIQVPVFDSKEFEKVVETIIENVSNNEKLLLENIIDSDIRENLTKTPTLKTVFSENIINQNIGLSLLILSIVIICLVIIFKR